MSHTSLDQPRSKEQTCHPCWWLAGWTLLYHLLFLWPQTERKPAVYSQVKPTQYQTTNKTSSPNVLQTFRKNKQTITYPQRCNQLSPDYHIQRKKRYLYNERIKEERERDLYLYINKKFNKNYRIRPDTCVWLGTARLMSDYSEYHHFQKLQ